MTLYYDAQSQEVLERRAGAGAAIAGILLMLIGILAGASILSVIL